MKKMVVFLLVAALAVGLCFKVVYRLFPMKYEDIIENYAEEYGLSKYLVAGVIYAESGFNHTAHSGLARGLMQLTDETADWVS